MIVSTTLLLNAAATFALVGLIWIVQLVLYPLFGSVGRERFVADESPRTYAIYGGSCDKKTLRDPAAIPTVP